MVIRFTTLPFDVTAGKCGGIVVEDFKTRQSWRLSSQQTREFVRLIGRQRRLAEHFAEHRKYRDPDQDADG
jgi:hypothetical protein